MDPNLPSYISIALSAIALGTSIYAVVKLPKKKKVSTTEAVREKPQVLTPTATPEVVSVEVPVETKLPVFVAKKVAPKKSENEWYLEANGAEGTEFSIQIEWSDGASDIVMHGVVPVELEFSHPKGVVPVKVLGIPPYGDKGVSYLWELNGFHWS